MPNIVIKGLSFDVIAPYIAGPQTLTEGEAHTLNQTLAENVRNNFSKRVADAQDEAQKTGATVDHDALQSALSEYMDNYEFGVRTGGGGRAPADPVASEALKMAKKDVRAALQRAFKIAGSPHYGKKLGDFSAERITDAAEKLVDQKPEYKERAAVRVAEMQDAAKHSMDDIMAAIEAVPATVAEAT